ncbi:MAG: putative bifunctional diguanylate cyclase/phosphodiesterase [Actinomycetes bacterium]
MKPTRDVSTHSQLVARCAVAGMSLAVVALGALAVWAALVIQNGAHGLSTAGVQATGHLRAVQSLGVVDNATDDLEDEVTPQGVRELRTAQQVLDDALARMEYGGVAEATRIAQKAKPIMRELKPRINTFLAVPRDGDDEAVVVAEEDMEVVMVDLQVLLNDLEPDPSTALTERLQAITDSEQTVRWVAFVLVPLGLLSVGLCARLLSGYRRRTDATMRSAIETTTREARTDQLTGLVNRRGLLEEMEHHDGARDHQPTVLVLDLDGFKDVNDSFGHLVGDRLLVQVAQRLRGCVRSDDMLARLGGDEFAVLLLDASPDIGEHTAGRITEALNSPFVIEGVTLDLEASVGIATAEPGQSLSVVVQHADVAMYAAKQHRLGHTRYDAQQTPDTAGRLTLLGALRRALTTDEIELHYQPKISVDTGEVIGAEALARWHHPTRGLLAPAEFIPVLESTSLIHPFTTHVLSLALGQVRTWLDAGNRVPMAVNVSTRSLLDRTFPDTVAHALATAGVPGDLLCIEITENTVMANPERAIEVLRRIRALGVKTSIDDFGTGYSSMAYLKILPVDEIKVDQSFVRDMATDHGNHVLVESAVDLGHNLGLAVVAEGVEDAPTLTALHTMGCDIVQGYYFARPLTGAVFSDYLATSRTESQSVTRTT